MQVMRQMTYVSIGIPSLSIWAFQRLARYIWHSPEEWLLSMSATELYLHTMGLDYLWFDLWVQPSSTAVWSHIKVRGVVCCGLGWPQWWEELLEGPKGNFCHHFGWLLQLWVCVSRSQTQTKSFAYIPSLILFVSNKVLYICWAACSLLPASANEAIIEQIY